MWNVLLEPPGLSWFLLPPRDVRLRKQKPFALLHHHSKLRLTPQRLSPSTWAGFGWAIIPHSVRSHGNIKQYRFQNGVSAGTWCSYNAELRFPCPPVWSLQFYFLSPTALCLWSGLHTVGAGPLAPPSDEKKQRTSHLTSHCMFSHYDAVASSSGS